MKPRNLLLIALLAGAAALGFALANRRKIGQSPVAIRLWSAFWQRKLNPQDTVVAVRGWRTALIDSSCYRRVSTLIPEWVFWDNLWAHYPPKSPFWRRVNKILRRLRGMK